MIVYLDASALVKRYIAETGTKDVQALLSQASAVVTNIITRAEVSAAIMRAARVGLIEPDQARQSIHQMRLEWENFQRLPVNEATVAQADLLVGEYNLRGYDAVHLAAATLWRQALGEPLTMATYDRHLWDAARLAGLQVWPKEI